jgi:hypothetical protein
MTARAVTDGVAGAKYEVVRKEVRVTLKESFVSMDVKCVAKVASGSRYIAFFSQHLVKSLATNDQN